MEIPAFAPQLLTRLRNVTTYPRPDKYISAREYASHVYE